MSKLKGRLRRVGTLERKPRPNSRKKRRDRWRHAWQVCDAITRVLRS